VRGEKGEMGAGERIEVEVENEDGIERMKE
jgi:hypothetical protein